MIAKVKSAPFRGSRRFHWMAAVATSAALLIPTPAAAEFANPAAVPANAAYVVSVPDGPSLWTAWKGNSLYATFNKVLKDPLIASKVEGFGKELAIIESSLGFPLNGDTLSQVAKAVDIYAAPGVKNSSGRVSAVFTIGDDEKLTKLMDLAEKAAAEAQKNDADDSESTATAKAADTSTSAVVSAGNHEGAEIRKFVTSDADGGIFYSRPTSSSLVFSNNLDEIKQVLTRLKTNNAAAAIGSIAEVKKITEKLAAQKGQFYLYTNTAQVLAMDPEANGKGFDITGATRLLNRLMPVSWSGMSLKFEPKQISSFKYAAASDSSSDSLVVRNPGTSALDVARLVPPASILTWNTSLMDSQLAYEAIGLVATAAGEDNWEKKLTDAEPVLGFSVKNDLLPALGNQLGFSISDVRFGGGSPGVDAVFAFSVKDKSKAEKVAKALERLAGNMVQARGGEGASSDFKEEKVGEATVRYVEIPSLAGLSPGYVLTDEFLMFGSTRTGLTNALNARTSGGIDTNAQFKSLAPRVTLNANILGFFNADRAWETVENIISAIPAASVAQPYVQYFKVFSSSGSASHWDGEGLVTESVAQLN